MATFPHPTPFVLRSLIVGLVLLGASCGRAPEETPAQPAVDPRFASATAILAHYNTIATHEPVDIVAVFDLCYAENNLQRRYIGLARQMLPFAQLDHLMFQRFGECFNPKSKTHSLAADQPAVMTRSDEFRAEASFIDSDGDSKTLYLVRIGDRWWVSGFTFEYEPQMKEYQQNMDALERFARAVVTCTPGVVDGIESGRISSATEAREAFRAAMQNAARGG